LETWEQGGDGSTFTAVVEDMVSAMKLYGTVRFFPLLTDCRTPEFRFPETDSRFLTLGDAARNPANAALLLSC
jgi:hypothetical protein